MIEYCERDTEVTEAVHKQLVKDMAGFDQRSIDLEHKVQYCTTTGEKRMVT